MNRRRSLTALFALIGSMASSVGASAQDDTTALAKKLANPISSLISVPFQFNYNGGLGPDEDGSQYYANVQPVIPIALNDDWNVISRTILPIVYQSDLSPTSGTQFGLGDLTQSFFLSPSHSPDGITWGIGPVVAVPTATDDLLGSGKLSIGPTGVALWQGSGWTVGALANQLWSVAGPDGRAPVSASFVQPFVSYTTKDAWTFSINTESTYNWETSAWSVPINAQVAKIVKFGKLPVQLFAGVRYWATSPDDVGPTGFGAR